MIDRVCGAIRSLKIIVCLFSAAAGHATEVFAPAGRGGSLLPSGFLSTCGNQIIDASSNPVRIASIGWEGADGPTGSTLAGLWATSYRNVLLSIKQAGFNTVRVAWSNAALNVKPTTRNGALARNPDLLGLTNRQIFQRIVDHAEQIGLKVIFDHHSDEGGGGGQQPNGVWIDKGPGTNGTDGAGHVGTVDAAKFQADWVQLAAQFRGNSTVIGYDLTNEPLEGFSRQGSTGAIWGGGGPLDIRAMYETVGNAIEAADPGALIIAEGPIAMGKRTSPTKDIYGFDLSHVETDPVVLLAPNKLVYSVHEYPSEIGNEPVDAGPEVVALRNKAWGYLVTRNIAPVWIGEMGSNMTSADSRAWARTLLSYMNGQEGANGGPTFAANQQPMSGSWWSAGWQAGKVNPGGIQNAWGLGHYRLEQLAVTDQILFKPVQMVDGGGPGREVAAGDGCGTPG